MPTIGNKPSSVRSAAAGAWTAAVAVEDFPIGAVRRWGGEPAARGERTSLFGRGRPDCFTIHTSMPFLLYEAALCQQVGQDLPDFHELVQP
jgi:hypothetical protein